MIRKKTPGTCLVVGLVAFMVMFCGLRDALADQWVKTYGGAGTDRAAAVQQTSDSGYIVAGSTSSSGGGKLDAWVIKLDLSGNIEWQKAYGGAEDDGAFSILEASGGGFVVVGYTSSTGAGKKDVWVLKLDEDGNVEWQKTYGGGEDDEAFSVVEATGGGFVVAGQTSSSGAGKKDVWVIKLDADGIVEWQKTYGGSGDDVAYFIQQALDEKLIVAGSTDSFGAGKKDAWILNLGKEGNIVWQKTYGALGDEEVNSIQQTSDSGYIAAGWTNSYAGIQTEAWVLKLDMDGNIQWQRTYGGSGDDKIYSIQETLDGRYIVAGTMDSYGSGKKDAWVMKLDANTSILWQKTFGGGSDDEAFSIRQTLDYGYAIAGWTQSFGAGESDAWTLKLDSNGSISGCQVIGTPFASVRQTTVSGVSSAVSPGGTSLLSQASPVIGADTSVAPGAICMVEEAEITIRPASMDFGSLVMGTSTSQTLTVENVGSKDLVLGSLDIGGTNHIDFGMRGDTCSGQTLKSFSDCSVEVSFSPGSGSDQRSAILSIPSNDSDFSNLLVPLMGEVVPPISPVEPPNHASFSACTLYGVPVFAWHVEGSFKNYQLQFSKVQNFDSSEKTVTVRTTTNVATPKANTWKQIMSLPGGPGGPVYWRVLGVPTSGKNGFLSYSRSFTVEPAEPVNNPKIASTGISPLPSISWENNCNVKFKVWFGADEQFLKKYTVSPRPIKNPLEGDGKFNLTLTSQQWKSIRNLAGNQNGAKIFWKVESWDGANRESQSPMGHFLLEE